VKRFDAVKAWGGREGVPVFDLVPAFRNAFAADGTWYHFRNDKHWTAAGHRLAAETLAALLRGSGVLGNAGEYPAGSRD
jgi:phospholipase/lecithinase/hemolysin